MNLIIGNSLVALGLVLGLSLPLSAQENDSQAVQTAGNKPLPEQTPGTERKPESPHAGGTDPALPQPHSKAEALSESPQSPSEDSEKVKQRKFVAPEVPKEVTRLTSYRGEYFAVRFGFAGVYDYNSFSQDATSKAQVGAQRDQWDNRSTRFMLIGAIGPQSYQMHYFASYEWNGFDAPQNKKPSWDFSDVALTFPVGKLGALTVGKNKESFMYEMVGDAAFLPSLERILNPFSTTRNVGVLLSNAVFDKRMTYAGGWFNDWWVQKRPFDGSSNQFTTRITGLLSINEDGSKYLHAGAGVRYAGATDGAIQLRGKPESDVTSYYVDTGKIPASNQKEFGFEGLWNHDNFSVLTEYVRSYVNATQFANPSFYGLYVTGSWIITGEHRPYDRNVGFARRLIPEHRWGAFELAARYSRLDLDDKSVHGGVLDKGLLDLSWYPNRWWRFAIAGGFTSLDRAGRVGYMTALQTRIQFVY
jgi:phosphate-selective porin OprO and OprP